MTKHIAIYPEVPPVEIEPEINTALSLDAPRSVAFKAKSGSFVYHFRRIANADWQQFFQSIVRQTVQLKNVREQVFETESALLELVDRTVTSVEGYGDMSGVKDWKRALPLHHRLAAGIALRSVGESQSKSDQPLLCDLVEVSLDANWGAGAEGKTTFYSGLIHRFRQPCIADLKRFNFESARVRVTGSAEGGTTTYPSRQAIALKIYDDLIESVDGYSVSGQPLVGVDAIKREMDGAHKAAAALALFDHDDEITIE